MEYHPALVSIYGKTSRYCHYVTDYEFEHLLHLIILSFQYARQLDTEFAIVSAVVCSQTFYFFLRRSHYLPPLPTAFVVMSRGVYFRSRARRSFEEIERLWTDYSAVA